MQDHVEVSTHGGPNIRQTDKQLEDNLCYTNNSEKSYNSRYLSHGIEQIVENASRHSHGIEQIVENASRHSHGIEQIVENVSRHGHGIEQIVENVSRHRHGLEHIMDNISRHSHGIEQIVDNVPRQSHGIEQIVDNVPRQSRGIEQIVDNVSRHNHGIEQIVDNVPRQSHGIEQIVDNVSRHNHGIEQIVDNVSRHSHGIEQIVDNVPRHSHGIEQIVENVPQHSHGIEQIVDNLSKHSHGIEQIVDNVSRHSHTQPSQHLLTTIFQPQHLKDSSTINDIPYYHAESSKPTSMINFPVVNTTERQHYSRDIQGSGNIESLLNYTASYSLMGQSPSKDLITLKTVKLASVDGNTSAPGFNVKETGLTMLSNLAHSRSPISEQTEHARLERDGNGTAEENHNAGHFSSVSDFGNAQGLNTAHMTSNEKIIKHAQSHAVDGSNSHSIEYIIMHDNQHTLGNQLCISNDAVNVSLEAVPYISKENTILCNQQLTVNKTAPFGSDFTSTDKRNHDICEEEHNFIDMFHCGACDLLFGTICNLHVHLESHSSNGLYVYDRTTRTGYPKFEVVSVGIQTCSEDIEGDAMFSMDREDYSDVNSSSVVFYPASEIISSDATPTTSSIASSIGSTFTSGSNAFSAAVTTDGHNDSNGNIKDEIEQDKVENHKHTQESCYDVNDSEGVNIDPENFNDLPDNIPEFVDDTDEDVDYSPPLKTLKVSAKRRKRERSKRKLISNGEIAEDTEVHKKVKKKMTCKTGISKVKSASLDKKKSEKQHPIPCSLCDEKFTFAAHLKAHLEKVHGVKKKYPCKTCSINFNSMDELRKHRLDHKQQIHKCDICDKIVSTAASLRDHRNFHMGVKPHECKTCGKQFRTTGQLNTHIRETHESGFNQQCEVCGKTFTSRYRMREHTKQCQDIKPHKCEFCGKRFIRTTQLRVHKRTHTGEKPYVCDICGCALTNYSSLIKHNRIHTGEKPYKCDQCPQAFTAKTTLNDHKRIHTQDKRFQCTHCGRSFIKKWNLKTHLRQHTGETPYTCSICGQGYKQNVLLKTHMQAHSKNGMIDTNVEVQMVDNLGQIIHLTC